MNKFVDNFTVETRLYVEEIQSINLDHMVCLDYLFDTTIFFGCCSYTRDRYRGRHGEWSNSGCGGGRYGTINSTGQPHNDRILYDRGNNSRIRNISKNDTKGKCRR